MKYRICVYIGVSTVALICWIKSRRNRKFLPRAPGIWIPFLGNVGQDSAYILGDDDLLKEQRELESDAITICHYFSNKYHFVITSLDLAKECFILNGAKSSGRLPQYVDNPSDHRSQGIACANGACWKLHRRTLITTLRNLGMGKSKIESMIKEEANYLIEQMKETYADSTIYPHRLFSNATLNIICQLTFGKRFDYKTDVFQQILNSLDVLFSVRPVQFSQLLPKWMLSLPGVNSQMLIDFKKATQFLETFCGDQIEDCKTKMTEDKSSSENKEEWVLEALISKQISDPANFNDLSIKNILIEIFAGGTDTSSSTLTWAVCFLKNHPDVQQLIRNEIKTVIGEGAISFHQIDLMPHLHAFILETQRFGTVGTRTLAHVLTEPIATERYRFPAGSVMQVSMFCVQRDKKAFKNPDKFDIGNFLEDGKLVVNENLIPFSLGPRMCPGDKLAKMEIFFFLVNLILNFNIESFPEDPREDDNAFQGLTRMPVEYRVRMTKI